MFSNRCRFRSHVVTRSCFSASCQSGGDGEQGHVPEHVRGERERLSLRGGVRRPQSVQTAPVWPRWAERIFLNHGQFLKMTVLCFVGGFFCNYFSLVLWCFGLLFSAEFIVGLGCKLAPKCWNLQAALTQTDNCVKKLCLTQSSQS